MARADVTGLRAIPPDFDSDRLSAVDQLLERVEGEHDIAIGLAIESGSRAWGFPSPDSDYDCRFIFVRGRDSYLSPWVRRDVIETPLVDDLDVNGWDLGKTLKLLLKGNAVAIEWLMSPIVYRGDPWFRGALAEFAGRFSNRSGVARHYLHLGERQHRTYFAPGKPIRLKKLFYALRPAMALRWLRLHPDAAVAPMHFPTLLAESEVPEALAAMCGELILRKARTRELGEAMLPPLIERFIEDEFAQARRLFPTGTSKPAPEAREAAELLFRSAVERLGSTGGGREARQAP
jgi:predicted nucleotidyltransferase